MSLFGEYSLLSIPDKYVMFDGQFLRIPKRTTDDLSPGLMVFYSEMCPHCITMYKKIKEVDRIMKQIGIKLSINVVPLPAEEGSSFELISKYYDIIGTPTVFYENGDVVIKMTPGNMSKMTGKHGSTERDEMSEDIAAIIRFIYNVEVNEQIRNKIGVLLSDGIAAAERVITPKTNVNKPKPRPKRTSERKQSKRSKKRPRTQKRKKKQRRPRRQK